MAKVTRFHLHRSVAAVIAIGVVASVVGFSYTESSVQGNNRLLLRQEAGQGAVVLGAFMTQFQSPFLHLATLAQPLGYSQSAFTAAGAGASAQAEGASVALLRDSGGRLSLLASVGVVHRQFGTPSDAALVAAASRAGAQFVGVTGANGKRWIGQLVGPPGVPAGEVLYWELPTSPMVSLRSIPGLPFSAVDAAVYFGTEAPSNLVFSTTTALPLPGQRAVVQMANVATFTVEQARISTKAGSFASPGNLILVMTATASLSGHSAAIFPWVLLLIGLGVTVAVAVALTLALRRRDEALGLVVEMKQKNEALDRAQLRQAEAEESLRQAQRLDAVGQLAGGIAHDFNNLLHVILSFTGFIDDALTPDSPLRADVAEVQSAARRAAELTRQLLVFARGEVVRADVLDANAVVFDTQRLLNHTLGEDIDLRLQLADLPCQFVADAGEINQVLMNLAINARDAMPRGGPLTIDVARVELSAHSAPGMGLTPGPHVRIEVTDTGEGMSRDVAARAFEPFFTTKETGRGTGLGLAMVYGIVARWHGFVAISSSPGRGTTVTLLFPVAGAVGAPAPGAAPAVPAMVSQPAGPGAGSVLLVEDEEGVRRSTARILQSAGYRVLQAQDADEAERVFAGTSVDLLLTDVVMPGGLSGKDLADRLRRQRPDLPIVFVTGYGSQAIAERGVLASLMTLVEKPFTADVLLDTVRSSLLDAQRVH